MNKKRISLKFIIGLTACMISVAISFGLFCWREAIIRKQLSQNMAERWSDEKDFAQISCFFSRNVGITEQRLIGFEHALDEALQEKSIKLESENPGARLWADTYSAPGKISVSSKKTSLYLNAIGVGGDFFQFHPQELLYGNYFSGSDVNQDQVVIDEEIAWQLFGGIDVSGKMIDVGGKPHLIAGVIKRPQGKMDQAAGLGNPIIYVSLETLKTLGSADEINHYEIVMPNPIKGFAISILKENLMMDENEVDYVQNTDRFSIVNSLKLVEKFGYRSMNGKAIIYPYWENLARGKEDVLALLSVFMVLFFGMPCLIFVIWIFYRWKHKNWTIKSVLGNVGNAISNWKLKTFRKKNFENKTAVRKTAERNSSEKKTAKKIDFRKKKEKKRDKEPIMIKFDEEEENEKD